MEKQTTRQDLTIEERISKLEKLSDLLSYGQNRVYGVEWKVRRRLGRLNGLIVYILAVHLVIYLLLGFILGSML